MVEDRSDRSGVGDEGKNSHLTPALRTGQRVDLIDTVDELGPTLVGFASGRSRLVFVVGTNLFSVTLSASISEEELYYRQGTAVMAVPVELEPAFLPGIPRVLFDGDYAEQFDVFPNGDFAMITLADIDLRELELVVNWSTELAELVPTP